MNQPKSSQALSNGEKLLFSLSKAFNVTQNNKLDTSAQEALAMYAEKILEKRRSEREKKQQETITRQYAHRGGKHPQNLYSQEDSKEREEGIGSLTTQVIEEVSEDEASSLGNYSYLYDPLDGNGKESRKVTSKKAVKEYQRPIIIKLLRQVLNEDFIFNISEFFSTKEIILQLRQLSTHFNDSVKKYLPTRLQQEAEFINAFLEENDILNSRFLKIVDTQIPLAKNNWLVFDFQEVITEVQKISKKDITTLKTYLKQSLKENIDMCLAPICLLFGIKEERVKQANGQVRQIWQKQCFKLVSNQQFFKQIHSFSKDTIKEETFLELFEYLNREELDLYKVMQVNGALGQFIKWTRMIASYHILVHPYKVRNVMTVRHDPDLYSFAETVDSFMDQFYYLKAFLIKLAVLPKDTNFAFNLSHVKFHRKDKKCLLQQLPPSITDLVLCYLDTVEAMKTQQASKKMKFNVASHWEMRLSYQILEAESLKTVYFPVLNKKIPLLYEGGFFSPYVKMLDRILMQEKNFVSKYHIEDIKSVLKPNKTMISIMQGFCTLLGIKPLRKGLPNGTLQIDYCSVFQQIAKNNKLGFYVNEYNKLTIKSEQLQQANLFISVFLKESSLEMVKQISKGFFQLFLWILSVITFNKLLNPFNFTTSDYVKKRFQSQEECQIVEQIYQSLEAWRQTFKLKSKNMQSYYSMIGQPGQNSHYSIESISDRAKQIFEEYEYNSEQMLLNSQHGNSIMQVEQMYFQVSNEIPQAARPVFIERVLTDFFANYFQFEAESTLVGDPFGVQSIASLDHFNKQIMPSQNFQGNGKWTPAGSNISPEKKLNQSRSIIRTNTDKSLMIAPERSQYRQKSQQLDLNVLTEILMYYNSVEQVVLIFAKLNCFFRMASIQHLQQRIIVMSLDTKRYEEAFEDIVHSIQQKRKDFYKAYDQDVPSKERALTLLNKLNNKDISMLKKVTKPTQAYEFFVTPLLVLFDKQPHRMVNAEGKTIVSHWNTAFKMFQDNFIQKLREFELESMTQEKFSKFSRIFNSDPKYTIKAATSVNPALGNLVAWILGVYEFHRFLRGYSITEADEKVILNKNELKFARKMDELILKNFRIMRFIQEKTGVNPLIEMHHQQHFNGHQQNTLDTENNNYDVKMHMMMLNSSNNESFQRDTILSELSNRQIYYDRR